MILVKELFHYFTQGRQYRSNSRLDGCLVAITGANTGIGKYTALDLSRRGAHVLLLCRSLERGEKAAQEIREATKGEVTVFRLDLSSLRSVKECCRQISRSFSKIDILINNAGVMACPETRTSEGFEMQIGVNHFGHFLLTKLLLPLLKKAANVPGSRGARVVTVSSAAHIGAQMQWDDLNWEKTTYSAFGAYQQSKLANVLFSAELARKLEGTGVTTYSLHPGAIATDLGRHLEDSYGQLATQIMAFARPFIKTVESGAQTTIFCAVEESIGSQTGRYYSDCRETWVWGQAARKEDAARLWQISEQMTQV